MLRSTFLYFITIAFLFLIPFFSLPISGFDAETSKVTLLVLWGCAAIILTALYAFIDKSWRNPLKMSIIGAASIMVFLLLLAAAFFSDVERISFFGDGFSVSVPLFVLSSLGIGYIISRFARDGRRGGSLFLALMGGLAVSVGLVFVTMIVRTVVGMPDSIASYVFGSIGKWNDIGIYAALLIVASLVAMRRFALSGVGAIVAYAVFGISLVMLAVVNIILVWVMFLLVSIVSLVLAFKNRKSENPPSKKYVWAIGIVAVVSLAFALDNQFGLLKGNMAGISTNVFSMSSVEAYPSLGSTLTVTKSALEQSPLFGYGPGRFTDAWRMYRPQEVNLSQFWSTDFTYGVGLWPTFLSTSGIIGFIGILAFILAVIGSAISLYRKSKAPGTVAYMSQTTSILVIFLTIVFFFYSPGFGGGLVYATIIGLLIGQAFKNESVKAFDVPLLSRWNMVGMGAFLLVVIISVGSLWVYGTKVYASYNYNKAVTIPVTDMAALGQISMRLEKAFNADHRDMYARSLGTAYYAQFNNLLVASSSSFTSADFQSMLDGVIAVSNNSIIANPYNSLNYIFLGEIYRSLSAQGVDAAGPEAEKYYNAAVTYDPYNPLIRVLQARLASQNNDYGTAKAKLEEAVALKPNYTEAVFLLSQLLIDGNEAEEAIVKLEDRTKVGPVEPIVFFQLGFLKYAQKDYVGAIPALETAVMIVPEYSNALYFLGLSYYYEDRDAEAIAVFERIVYLNPDSAEATSVLQNMKEGTAPFASTSVAPEDRAELPVEEESSVEEE